MKQSLLLTKLYIPPPNPKVVNRPKLLARINEGLRRGCKLTLISAPVGYGKTTLVSNWLSTLNCPIAWLSLDPEDSDPIRFWNYVFSALQTAQVELDQTVLSMLQTEQMPPVENILNVLINQITALPDKVILILDDYHLIDSSSLHLGFNYFLDHLPPQMHLVIITREDPPLPLPQMRVKEQMTELRAKDLRFTAEESAQFLNQSMNLNLQSQEISILDRRTEGWVAGLQMAAISMQDMDDKAGFINAFAGDDRYVVDYLIEEVIEHQPEHIQEFLLQTAILRQFTASLCDAVTGMATGRDNLAYLEETNLFLISLDNKRQWYRYHQLFGDLLQYRLRNNVSAEGINKLHKRAAEWYTKHGSTDEAVSHFLAYEAYTQAADLIEPMVIKLIVQGQLRKVFSWLAQFPDDFIFTRPLLCVSRAWVLTVTGQGAEVETWLARAEQGLRTSTPMQAQKIRGLILIVRSYLARNQGNILLSISDLRQSKEGIEPNDLIVRSLVNLNLGFNYSILGQLDLAEQSLLAVRSDGKIVNAVYLTLLAMAIQGIVYTAQGKLHRAIHLYQEAIAYGQAQNKGHPFPPAGYAYAGLGQALYEQNNLQAAEQHLTMAIEFGELMGDWSMKRRGLLPLAWLKEMQGDSVAAQELWQRALSVVHQAESSRVETTIMVHRARLWLAQAISSPSDLSALAAAADWAESYQKRHPDEHSFQEAFAQTTLAWVELAQDLVDKALSRLDVLAEIANANGWNDNLIKVLVLKALAYARKGEIEPALDILSITLAQSAHEGYIRTFVDHGQPMQKLLQEAASRGIWPDMIALLLASFPNNEENKGQTRAGKPITSQTMIEPLTDREISILSLMAAGLSHHEIAEELYLSVNTIKWHVTHIYNKLGVHRRSHAVTRSRELGIL